MGVKLKLISDGDIRALLVTKPEFNVDIFLGIGGDPRCFSSISFRCI